MPKAEPSHDHRLPRLLDPLRPLALRARLGLAGKGTQRLAGTVGPLERQRRPLQLQRRTGAGIEQLTEDLAAKALVTGGVTASSGAAAGPGPAIA